MSRGVVRQRINFPRINFPRPVTCAGCGKVAYTDPSGRRFYLYRYRPFRGAPLVCSRECDIRARPALELERTGGGS